MRIGTTKPVGLSEKSHNLQQTVNGCFARNPVAVGSYNNCHDAKPGTACCYCFVSIIINFVATLTRKAAHRMRKVPEVAKGLLLYQFYQCGIGKIFLYDSGSRSFCVSLLRCAV